MLRAVIDGRMSGSEFARHLAANATDISWLDATGQAVSELGVLLQSANAAAVERSKLQFATALRTIDEHKRALSSLTSERDALLSKLNQAEEQSKHQKETIDFLSTFSPRQPHPPASDEKKGRNFARAVKAAYGKKVAAAVAASEAAVDAEARPDRIARFEGILKERDDKVSKELKQVKANQAVEIKRLCAKLIEERRVHAAAVETCYESAERQRKDDINRVKGAEAGLEAYRLREASARAQASAASEVLMETQLELRALRAELARTKLLVQSEMSKRPNSGAEFPLEARVRRASIEESYSGQDATPPPPPLNSPEPLRR